jgi:imidazolonepropionase-like amidohydrolase
VIDLGSLILLPGLMDMEVNLLMGDAITPTGGHLDPTMFNAMMPGLLTLSVEEDGVSVVRHSVRYQIKHGATLIKVCASGGVMSHTGTAGAQHYSDEELRAIVDEARLMAERPTPRLVDL